MTGPKHFYPLYWSIILVQCVIGPVLLAVFTDQANQLPLSQVFAKTLTRVPPIGELYQRTDAAVCGVNCNLGRYLWLYCLFLAASLELALALTAFGLIRITADPPDRKLASGKLLAAPVIVALLVGLVVLWVIPDRMNELLHDAWAGSFVVVLGSAMIWFFSSTCMALLWFIALVAAFARPKTHALAT